jgi:ribosome-binding factor A
MTLKRTTTVEEFSRSSRIAQSLQKEIATVIRDKLQDPRLSIMITVSEVRLSRDLTNARVFITLLNNEDIDKVKIVIKILQDASSYIQSFLGKTVHLRTIPRISFYHDNSLAEGARISNLVTYAVQKDIKTNKNYSSDPNQEWED